MALSTPLPLFVGAPVESRGTQVDTIDSESVLILILRQFVTRSPQEPGRLAGFDIDPVGARPIAAQKPLPQAGASGPGESPGLVPIPVARLSSFVFGAAGDSPVAGTDAVTGALDARGADALTHFATEDFTTSPLDPVEANRWFDGRIQDAGTVSRALSLTALDAAAIAIEQGRMTLNNADGRLDSLPDRSDIQGAEAVLAVARRGTRLDGWTVVSTGRVQGVDINETEAEFSFVGADYRFSEEYSTSTYAGTGDAEGPATLADTSKPILIGRCYNVTPVLVNPLTYVFQVSSQPLAAVTAVRFGGAPFTATVDYATYALLNATSVATGFYATCRAEGLIKVGLSAGGLANGFTVTVDAESALVTAPEIAFWLAEQARVQLDVDVNLTAFLALQPEFANYVYGNYLTAAVTWRALLDDVMTCMNAYWGVDRLGAITCGWFDVPDPSAPDIVDLGEADILSIDRLALPSGFEWPHSMRTIKFGRNWSVLSTTAAIVNNPRLSQEWRRLVARPESAPRTAVAADPVEVNLQNIEAVEDLGNRLMRQHGALRVMYSVTVPIARVLLGELTQVRVTYPRFGLDTGRVFIVMATLENYDARQATLTLWG
jgi:hypothetical protein